MDRWMDDKVWSIHRWYLISRANLTGSQGVQTIGYTLFLDVSVRVFLGWDFSIWISGLILSLLSEVGLTQSTEGLTRKRKGGGRGISPFCPSSSWDLGPLLPSHRDLTPSALLGLQLADSRSYEFSPSIITWANSLYLHSAMPIDDFKKFLKGNFLSTKSL